MRRGRAGQEIVGVPIGRRLLGVLDEIVERREPARADPAAGVDERDVEHVIGRARGRQLEVGALVVDREGRRVVIDLGAGRGLELGQVLGEISRISGSSTRR